MEIHLAADEVVTSKHLLLFSGSSREARTCPFGTTRRRSRHRGGTSNRSSRGSRKTSPPRERGMTRPVTKTRARTPRTRRASREEPDRALETKKTKSRRRAGWPGSAPLRWSMCGILHDVLVQQDADGAVASAGPWRPLCTTPRRRPRKRAAPARRGRNPEPSGRRFVRVLGSAVLRPRGLLQRAEGSHAHRARERRGRHEHVARGADGPVAQRGDWGQTSGDGGGGGAFGFFRPSRRPRRTTRVAEFPCACTPRHPTSRGAAVAARRRLDVTPVPVFARGGVREASFATPSARRAAFQRRRRNDGEWWCFVQGVDV